MKVFTPEHALIGLLGLAVVLFLIASKLALMNSEYAPPIAPLAEARSADPPRRSGRTIGPGPETVPGPIEWRGARWGSRCVWQEWRTRTPL
jgi:hypothetical protein